MNLDKVAMSIRQQVSGIRVETLKRGYAELEELRVVFDRVDPYPWLVDKVVGLMKKHAFCNTHAYSAGRRGDGEFTMVFARATSVGIAQLERIARKSRAEICAEAVRRSGAKHKGLADDRAARAILITLATAGGRMLFSELAREVVRGRGISPTDLLAAMAKLEDHKFVERVSCAHTIEQAYRLTRRAAEYFSTFCN